MTFPTVETTATSFESPGVTTHNITLPSGIVSGDLLIAILALDGDNADSTWPGGWDEMIDLISTRNRMSIGRRVADGTEGATVDVTTDNSRESAHIAYRISGHDSSQVPEISTGATGASITPDPDSLTPTGGAKDYLWLAIAGTDSELTVSAFPSSYVDGIEQNSEAGSFGTTAASAQRELNAASEDPGTFTMSATEQWTAATIAVHPAAAAVGFSWPSPKRHPNRNVLLRL